MLQGNMKAESFEKSALEKSMFGVVGVSKQQCRGSELLAYRSNSLGVGYKGVKVSLRVAFLRSSNARLGCQAGLKWLVCQALRICDTSL
jgi:hypothetical protein